MENMSNKNTNVLSDVLLVVLLYKNENFNVRAPYDIEILGKKMWEWVAMSASGAKIKTTPCTKDSDVLSLVKPFINDEKITVVLYSDTPLLTKQNLLEILDYFKGKGQNVLKLKRGYVFDSEYLKQADSIMACEDERFSGEEFEPVQSFEDVMNVQNILKDKILKFHMANGVFIVDKSSTFIDADVVIERGAIVEPNNQIKGESYVGENAVIEANNIIKSSIIGAGARIKCSYVQNGRIEENAIIGPFEKIVN